ncbi:unnamed protein product [Adineta steineri]|uniref:Uncharacterized protein n=1 Tax=Adineta steineri TaxID=433720 RepID=A0A813TV82_9BILA|nr:unnamed protein product [Adineta steineri]
MSEVTTKDKPTNFSTDLEIVKSESKLHQSRSIIREFSLNTSMHGIAGISRSQSIHNRIFWSIAILIFTVLALIVLPKLYTINSSETVS